MARARRGAPRWLRLAVVAVLLAMSPMPVSAATRAPVAHASVVDATGPSAPRITRVWEIGIAIGVWTSAPEVGADLVTRTDLQYSTDGSTWTTAQTTTFSSTTLYAWGLEQFTSYYVRLGAVSDVAPTVWSEPQQITTTYKVAAIADGTFVGRGVDWLEFSWDLRSSDDYGDALGFYVEYRRGFLEPYTRLPTLGPDARGYTLTGLEPGATYQFRVAPFNERPLSDESWYRWTEATYPLPPAPEALAVSDAGVASATLTWAAPRDASWAAATDCRVEALVEGTWHALVTVPAGPTSMSAEVPGLEPDHTYSVRVVPVAGHRDGTPSEPIDVVTGTLVPDDVFTASVGMTSSWFAGVTITRTSSDSISYEYQVQSSTAYRSWRDETVSGPSAAVLVDPGTTTLIRIRACAEGFCGGWTEMSVAAPAVAFPAPYVSATWSQTSATLRWSYPEPYAPHVTRFTATLRGPSGATSTVSVPGGARTVTFEGLRWGTGYAIELHAVTPGGLGASAQVSGGTYFPPGFAQVVLSADLTADGQPDLVTVDWLGNLGVAAGVRWRPLFAWPQGGGGGWANLAVYAPGDWNEDGFNDLVAVDPGGRLLLYAGNGRQAFRSSQIGNGWTGYRITPAGDVDGDHHPDLLAIDPHGLLWLHPGVGDGRFRPRVQVGNGWTTYQLYAAGDQNRDGRADIVGIDADGRLFFYAGRGGGYFSQRVQVGNGWKGYLFASGADVNGDGFNDLIGQDLDGVLWYYAGRPGRGYAQRVMVDLL